MQSLFYGTTQPAHDIVCSWVTPDCPVAGVCDPVLSLLRMAVVAFVCSRDRFVTCNM